VHAWRRAQRICGLVKIVTSNLWAVGAHICDMTHRASSPPLPPTKHKPYFATQLACSMLHAICQGPAQPFPATALSTKKFSCCTDQTAPTLTRYSRSKPLRASNSRAGRRPAINQTNSRRQRCMLRHAQTQNRSQHAQPIQSDRLWARLVAGRNLPLTVPWPV
jgi:hypothetical protein